MRRQRVATSRELNGLNRRRSKNSGTVDGAPLERYKFILQQIHTVNENVYKTLAIYQTLATALIGAALAIFVGYKKWGIAPQTAQAGVTALVWLLTFVASFAVLLLVTGILSWFDYRREECEFSDRLIEPGFRSPPRIRNLFRWYETYIIIFIVGSTILMWLYARTLIIPAIR